MKYRCELDALNAIYAAQLRTNELLEQVLNGKLDASNIRTSEANEPANNTPGKRQYERRRKAQ